MADLNKRDIHGHTVVGDDAAAKGMAFLDESLQYAEAEVFFQQARGRGEAEFEDAQNRNYTLQYSGDGTYTVVARDPDSGGFFRGWF